MKFWFSVVCMGFVCGTYCSLAQKINKEKKSNIHKTFLDSRALALCILDDNKRVVACDVINKVTEWFVEEDKCRIMQFQHIPIIAAAFSSQGRCQMLAYRDCPNYIRIFDYRKRIMNGVGVAKYPYKCAITNDAKWFALVPTGKGLYLYRKIGEYNYDAQFLECSVVITSAAFSADDTTLVMGLKSGTIKYVPLTSVMSHMKYVPHRHKGPVDAVAMNSKNGTVVSGSRDTQVFIHNVSSGVSVGLKAHKASVNSVALSRDGGRVVTSVQNGTVLLYDVRTGNQ